MFSSLAAPFLPGRGAARLAAGALASALAVAGAVTAAAPAAAQDGARDGVRGQGGATATIGGLKTHGTAVIHGEDGDQQVPAGLFEMSVEGGGMLQTYCVDIQNPTQKDAKYQETPWSGTSLGTNKDAGRVRWILGHSYPQVNDLAALAKKAGVRGGLTEEDAAAGTQVAIWRYSDDTDVEAVDPQAERLADYLEKNARDLAEPAASLALDPPAVSGRPGERLGPVTVHTNAGGATVTPPVDAAAKDAVRIVDKKGEPVTEVTDGTQIFFDVPEDAEAGTARLSVQASTTVPVGRAFASESRSQTQILAGSSESTVTATATATWAAEGPIPALSAEKNCAEGTLDITALNKGDEPFTFELLDTEYTVAPGATRTVPVPLPEDRAYDFTIRGPAGFEQRFNGVLDCRTQSAALADTTHTLSEPAPAPVVTPSPNPNLAETGSSDATPLIGGAAIGLVVIGGAVLLFVRRRNES
ncbi:Cys-Gln thioester bond-forming surface protein [Streptomyces sp. RM72]|uniref:Cys-Gln thioester bond-forming surface protein n=1 Tax=Streptomyces sp. RM72 TaxID=1115510 RepID=UPI001B376B70|nr:Cys-Gln thioester bond-forming surface protein [Streptomyces sp. RM72]MBQ0886319.1 Cys-Gln thioester bond-forming surface protein [Streptomyces sp. RM72]